MYDEDNIIPFNRAPTARPVESPEAAQFAAQASQRSAGMSREPSDIIGPAWRAVAAGKGNRFQSAPESYIDEGKFNEGKYIADLIASGVNPTGDVAKYGRNILQQTAQQKQDAQIDQALKVQTPFSDLDEQTFRDVINNIDDAAYPPELVNAAYQEMQKRTLEKSIAEKSAQVQQQGQSVQPVAQQSAQPGQQPQYSANTIDPTGNYNAAPGVPGHDDALGSAGHNTWIVGDNGTANQQQQGQQFAAAAGNERSPDELQLEGERWQYDKQRREHPWLNFFLGSNKDEQYAEDHGWKYHNNIEHGWVMPNQQSFRTGMANTEKWITSPEQQRYIDDQKAKAAAAKLQRSNKVMRASYANSMLSSLNRIVREGGYDRDSQAFQREMQNVQQLVNSFPDDGGIGTQSRNMIVAYANQANRDYWSRINFDPKSLERLGRMQGAFTQLSIDLRDHYDPATNRWDDEDEHGNSSHAIAWNGMVDALVDSIEQIVTGSGANMADAARLRAWHKYVSPQGFAMAKGAIENYAQTLSQIVQRITNPSSKQMMQNVEQQTNVLKQLLNAGKQNEGDGWENKVRSLLDSINDTFFALKMADFANMTKEDYNAAITGMKNLYDAYQQALLFSGGLDNKAVMMGLESAANQAKRAYNIKARQINAKPFTNTISFDYTGVPNNPRNYDENVTIPSGIPGFNPAIEQKSR